MPCQCTTAVPCPECVIRNLSSVSLPSPVLPPKA